MATINLTTTLAVSPEDLWAEVKDVGGLSNLLGVIVESSVDGDQRSLTMGDGGHLTETILGIDDDHQRVAYTITESPFPIEGHASSMQVSDAGGGKSTFQWVTDITPDALAEPFTGLMTGELQALEERFGV